MNIGIWLTSAVGAAVLAATLAVAPITSAQQTTTTDDAALVMQSQGQGHGAQGPHGDGTCSGDTFVDADGDGVCDNMGTDQGQQGQARGSHGDGDGVCTDENFVDADGDGVCDNMGTGTGQGNNHGNSQGNSQGRGHGRGRP